MKYTVCEHGAKKCKCYPCELEGEIKLLKSFIEKLAYEMTEKQIIKATTGLDEHPEFWENGCNCDLCLSYAD